MNIPDIIFASECTFAAIYIAVGTIRGWPRASDATFEFIERTVAALRIVAKPFLALARIARDLGEWSFLIGPVRDNDDMPAAADETPSFPLTEYNILDLCMPPYQLLTATIDTLNVIAFGILALAFSLLVVIIELFGEIRPELRTPGSYLLAIAVSLAAVAFLMGDVAGFRGWSNKFDGRRFLIGYTQLGRTAVLETIQAVIAGTSAIGKVRDRKRLFLLVALLFCIGAAVCIAIGRAEAENPASPLLLSSWRRGRYLKPEIGAKMPAMEKGSSAPEQAATKSKTQPDDTQLSEGLRALGRKYAEETGFEPLKPGERLKPLWYLTNMSGKSLVGINERIKPR